MTCESLRNPISPHPLDHLCKGPETVCVSWSPGPLVNKPLHQGGWLEKQMAAAPCVQLLVFGLGREYSR